MDANTRFIIQRMDAAFKQQREEFREDIRAEIEPVRKLSEANARRIEALERWQSKLAGIAITAGAVGALFVKAVFKI